MNIKDILDWRIMPQTIKPMGLVHVAGTGPNNRFDFKNKGNNRVNEAKDSLVLEKLPYKISDLEPVLSKINVDYHYNVLSAGYVNRYNNKEGDSDFNYGGAMLHNLFWAQLQKPKISNNPSGSVKELIDKKFKDYKKFKEEMLGKAMSIQGSGWVYLSKSGEIKTTPNQSYKTDILMPIDMWEHSFSDYVPAKDAKKRYIENMMKIINWEVINHRMSTLNEDTVNEKCWDGYKQVGMKNKGGRQVPNCVPEEAAGVGIITKQNTTKDVKPGDEYKNVKKLHLEWQQFKENTGIDWNALRTAGVVQPMLYDVPNNPVRPTAQQPNIITAVNLKQKLGPGEKLTPLNDKAVTPEFWQKYMDDWWTKNKNDPRAKNKIDQIKQSARMKGVQFNENFADKKVKGKSRPGRVKRAGASCKGSVTSLRSKAKKSSGEKAKMYHWCANMKSGRKKSR